MMNLIKLSELKISDNDVYLLETFRNRIIINDNYEGIQILDDSFNRVKTVKIFNDLVIERCYKQLKDNILLLYSYENSCFICIDMELFNFTTIKIEQSDKILFSPLYWWVKSDEIILVTYKKELYLLSCTEFSIRKINESHLQDNCPEFYKIWLNHRDCSIVYFSQDDSVLLGVNQENDELIIYDYRNAIEERIAFFLLETHDFAYKNKTILFIHEKQLDVLETDSSKVTLQTESLYIYTVAQFLDDDRFIALQNNLANHKENILTLYQLDSDS